jgi:hypothetical protein
MERILPQIVNELRNTDYGLLTTDDGLLTTDSLHKGGHRL